MLCRTLPCTAEQFMSQAERNQARNVDGEQLCTRHGLSVFPNYKSCEHLLRARPQLGPHIVKATLTPDHGLIAETPSNRNPQHHTWWPFTEVPRASLFISSEGEGEQK